MDVLLERWRNGETTIAFHRGGNSLSDLTRIINNTKNFSSDEFNFAVECDLKWTKDNGEVIPYVEHGGGLGESVYNNGSKLAAAERRGDALSLDAVLDNDEKLLYNFDVKCGLGDSYKALERTLTIADKYAKVRNVWFMAFNLDYLRRSKEVNPEIPTMFTSFFTMGYNKLLHQPSFRNPLLWEFVKLSEMNNVDIITTWPRAKLSRGDYGLNPFTTVMLVQKSYDFVMPGISFDSDKRIIEEAKAFEAYGKLSFPGDFNMPYGVREYLRIKKENELAIAGAYVNIPEDISSFLKECGLNEREIKNI